MELKKEILDKIEEKIKEAGHFATAHQKGISTKTKADGSPVTMVDITISDMIIKTISTLLPSCNIISEESLTPFSKEAPYSFILDPIDGTDVYSQGLPSFAIALGILNQNRESVGAMIYAPRFGIGEEELFLRLDPDGELLLNGNPFKAEQKDDIKQITMSSKGQRLMDFSAFHGKVRTFGSTILHLISPVVFKNISASVTAPCYVWDFAAAHAILKSQGYEIKYYTLEPLIYTDELLVDRKMLKGFIFAGTEKGIANLYNELPLKTL